MWNSIWHFVDEWRNKLRRVHDSRSWFESIWNRRGGTHCLTSLLNWRWGIFKKKFRWPWVVYLVQWLNCSWIRGCKLGREFLWPFLVSLWGRSWGFYSVLTLASNLFKNFYNYSLCRPMWFEVRGILDGLCLLMLSYRLSVKVVILDLLIW